MTWTQTTINIKDAAGTNQPVIAYTDGTNFSFAHPLLDNAGAIISPATAANQTTANTALGAPADTAVTNPSLVASVISALKGALSLLAAATPAGTNLIGKVGIDQTSPGTSNRAVVSLQPLFASASFTRPGNTTSYSLGGFVANSGTAGSVVALALNAARGNDIPGRIPQIILKLSKNDPTNAVFRVHFFNSNPVASAPQNGDGGNYQPANGAGYLGSMDVTCNTVFGDGVVGIGSPTSGSYINFTPAAGTSTVYALIEARAGYTPASAGTFTLTTVTE